MIAYICGKISDNNNYAEDFEKAEMWLKLKGYDVFNPAKIANEMLFLSYKQHMQVDFKLIELSDCVFMLHNWQESKGAIAEIHYAKALRKKVLYQDYFGRKNNNAEM